MNPEIERKHLLNQIEEWQTLFADYFWSKAKDAQDHSADVECQQWMTLYKHARKISDDVADLYFAWGQIEAK